MKKNHRIMTAALVIAGLLTIMTAGAADGTHAAVRTDHNINTAEMTARQIETKADLPLQWNDTVRSAADAMELPYLFSAKFAQELAKIDEEAAREEAVLEDQETPLAGPQEDVEAEKQKAEKEAAEEAGEEAKEANEEAKEEAEEEAVSEPEEPAQEEAVEETEEETKEEAGEEATEEAGKEEEAEQVDTEEEAEAGEPEDSSIWEKTLPKQLPAKLKKAIAAVARSQEGYKQEETEDGAWCRYGAFMGDPYDDPWDAEFVLFTLYYAGALDVFAEHPDAPVDTDTVKWIRQLRDEDMILAADEYSPEAGDIVFLPAKNSSGGDSARAAVVTEGGEDSIHVISQGAGENSDQVREETCSIREILCCAVPALGGGFEKAADILAEADQDAEAVQDEAAKSSAKSGETAPTYVAALEELNGEEAKKGLYLSVARSGSDYYFQNALNNNNAFKETTDLSEASAWYFEKAETEGTYRLFTKVGDKKQYLKNTSGNLAGLAEEGGTAFTISMPANGLFEIKSANEKKWLQHSNSGNGIRFWTDNNNNANCRIKMMYAHIEESEEPSEPEEERNTVYSASKVSVSDTERVTNGSRVIIYTRSWDDEAKRYVFYAVDHDGSLVPCYESGDSIQWKGTRINTLLWNFTEYYWEGTSDPNFYYELKNPYSGKYIAPQIAGSQILSEEPIGVNLNGRRYGDYYTTIVAWDDPYYAYAGLKVEDGKIVSCPFAEAEDFYFAIMQDAPEAGKLTEIPTIDHTQYGIHMRVSNYNTQTKVDGNNTTKEQHSVLGDSTGGAVTHANTGLVSTDLKENGYPEATKTGQSLSKLFAGGKEANHLFVGSTYSGSGYYEFDSTQNFASLCADGSFKVYKELGTTDASNKNSLKHGQFFPYNDLDPSKFAKVNPENLYNAEVKELSDKDPRKHEKMYLVQKPDYYFGVEIEASFVQTPNGHDAWGHDIIYEFTGDDDFWLYVDGELVIDLGGIHSALPGSVNYCTGEVKVNGTKTTLKQLFESNYRTRGLSENEIKQKIDELFVKNAKGQYIFKDYSTHTMKIFFMERGGGASNLHMRFNLSSVKSGQILLNKQLSGTDKKDYKLAEYAYQIWYQAHDKNGLAKWHRLNEKTDTGSNINVSYQNTNIPAKYASSFTPAGGHTEYKDVYFLTAGQTVAVSVPKATLQYRIVECGVNTQVYDKVKANDAAIEPETTPDTGRANFETAPAKVSERQRVVFDNHVSDAAKRTLTISKKLYDQDNKPITDDPTGFNFRLYLAGENDTDLEVASLQDYCVKDPKGNYCKWDAEAQEFKSLGKSDFAKLTAREKLDATFQTSFNGSISKIPAEYRVEVRDLLVGTKFKIEERPSEIPAGYKLIGYVREGNSYITQDGQDNIGTIRENESPAIEVHNRRGFGLTVNKAWSDASFMESHGDVYFGIYVNGKLLDGSVQRLAHPAKKVYYYFDELQRGATLADYDIREVTLEGDHTVDEDTGIVTPAEDCQITPIDEGGILRITAKAKEDEKPGIFDYAVSYAAGKVGGAAHNVRSDTVTNSRHGIRLVKQDWNGNGLAGAMFRLTDSAGSRSEPGRIPQRRMA